MIIAPRHEGPGDCKKTVRRGSGAIYLNKSPFDNFGERQNENCKCLQSKRSVFYYLIRVKNNDVIMDRKESVAEFV